ncbi:ATP synthase F(1) complex subunit gamma, mitochondrial-like isoform X2 [Saccoglossus kowalevskii]
MKMVSASKYNRAERELKPAKAYGLGASAFYNRAEITQDETKPNHLLVAMSSDRGLCGGIHSSICKAIKADVAEKPADVDVKIACIGDKSRLILQRVFSDKMLFHVSNIGKKPSTFGDAANIANAIVESGFEFDVGKLYYNRFKSVVSFQTTTVPVFTVDAISNSDKISIYDDVDSEVLQNYCEFSLVNLVYFTLKEGACSELSARMTAMEAASKNAGEMIDKLTLKYNRTRQAVITRELIEIISGAAAL